MKIILKKVNEELKIIESEKRYATDAAREFFDPGTKLEKVKIDEYLYMYIDAIGAIKDLDINFYLETNSPYFPIQAIHGDAIFIKIKEYNIWEELWDYEVDNIENENIELIEEIIED